MILTIIIPSYQLGHTIGEALDSIRQQGFSDYEVLIMDGGSTDSTASVVAQASDLPITFIQEKDAGVYDAMNKGVELAKGKWLYFMGADDSLYKNILCDINQLFNEDNADMLYGNVILSSNGAKYDGEFDLHKLLCIGNICHQAIFYRNNVFKILGKYNTKYKIWADWDFNIRFFKDGALVAKYFDKVVAFYDNQSGLSSNNHDAILSKEIPFAYINRISVLEQENKSLLASRSFIIGNSIVRLFHKIGIGKSLGNNGSK